MILHQHVLSPTRFRTGQNPSLLDLVFTKFPDSITAIEVEPPLGRSDHAVITCDVWITNPEPARPAVPQRRFSAMNSELLMLLAADVDWSALEQVHSVGESGFSLETSFFSSPIQSFPFGAKLKTARENLG